jgi:hypothetical protein
MGEGVRILKPTQGGVSLGRFSGSEKKEHFIQWEGNTLLKAEGLGVRLQGNWSMLVGTFLQSVEFLIQFLQGTQECGAAFEERRVGSISSASAY